MHIDYYDAMSHPWFAGGDGAAVYVCARRDRPSPTPTSTTTTRTAVT